MYRVLTMDLVPSRCPTEAEGGRCHFLFDPLSVEPDLCGVALGAGPADQYAFDGAVGCLSLSHIVVDCISERVNSNDCVMTSDT